MKRFEISLFKFNPKTDYLPYYKKINIKSALDVSLLDLLKEINNSLIVSFEDCLDFGVVVNGKYLLVSEKLEDIYNKLGNDLVIEPISTKRAIDDLIIDDSDFYQRLESFNQFLDDEDRANYEKYKLNFYASNSLRFNEDYIGDALLYIVNDMINKNLQHEKEILKMICDKDKGIIYHTDSSNRLFNNKKISLDSLIQRIDENKLIDFNIGKFEHYIEFEEFKDLDNTKYNFEKFNIAYFGVNSDKQNELNKLNSTLISLNSNGNDLAIKALNTNKEFTYKISADILLEAFDKGADFLVVDNYESFYLFDKLQNDIEKVAQRDINLPIIHISELESLAKGKLHTIKDSLTNHKIKVNLI